MRKIPAALATLLLFGCDKEQAVEAPEALPANIAIELFAGSYSGNFPCDGCAGIDVALWLRHDGRFFYRQRYAANEQRAATVAHSLGVWTLVDDGHAIELRGEGPVRKFTRDAGGILHLETLSTAAHQLERKPVSVSGIDAFRMRGVIDLGEGGPMFTECLTQLAAPISKNKEYNRFLHQYRSANRRNRTALVELEGRFTWQSDAAPRTFQITRFATIRNGDTC